MKTMITLDGNTTKTVLYVQDIASLSANSQTNDLTIFLYSGQTQTLHFEDASDMENTFRVLFKYMKLVNKTYMSESEEEYEEE